MALIISHLTPDDGAFANIFGVNWRGQTFTAPETFDITSIKWALVTGAGSPPDMTVSINTTLVGKPTLVVLVSKTQAYATGTVEFTFATNPTLTSGVVYAIVGSIPAGDGSNYGRFDGSTDASYSGGNYTASGDSGVTWSAPGDEPDRDILFEVYGTSSAGGEIRRIGMTLLGVG